MFLLYDPQNFGVLVLSLLTHGYKKATIAPDIKTSI